MFKPDIKFLRKIAMDKYGASVIATMDDSEIRTKIFSEFTLLREISDPTKVYIIAKNELPKYVITCESKKA